MTSIYSLQTPLNKRFIGYGVALFIMLSLVCGFLGYWKVVAISWVAFLAMALAIPFGARAARNKKINHLIAGYGLSSGAMITSAAVFLVPMAISYNPVYGGLGIAAGIIAGFAIHTLNHSLSHQALPIDAVVVELTSHALSAGVIIGIVYAAMPQLSLLLGVAIISHKAPAGYAAARRLTIKGSAPMLLLLPACSIGLTALPVSLINIPGNALVNALIFGFATGVFFHVAIDFLPECEVGGKIHQQTNLEEHEHHQLDHYRKWAIFHTFAGGVIVFVLWYISH